MSRLLALVALLLLAACATAGAPRGAPFPPPQQGWTGGTNGVPSHYAQSCMAHPLACSPAGASGEILVPTTVTRVVEAVEVVQGLLTLKDFLDEAEVKRVEEVLVQCTKEADLKINEQEYGPGKYPSDGDANKIQFLYDFLFPCTSGSKSDPLGHARRTLIDKLAKYENLPGQNRRALVTPQLGISR